MEPTSPQAKPIVAPNGLDLHPAPQKTLRINRRASIIAGVVGLCFLVGWAYGGFQRSATTEQQARNKGVPKNIVPATTAGNEFTKEQSGGLDSLPMDSPSMHKLLPPASPEPAQVSRAVCGTDSRTGQVFRFDPQTGKPCAANVSAPKQQRAVVRQPAPVALRPPAPAAKEPSQEERRVLLAYQREQEARLAPTVVSANRASQFHPGAATDAITSDQNAQEDVIASLKRAVAESHRNDSPANSIERALGLKVRETDADPDAQPSKETFLETARSRKMPDNYLHSTRTAPLSPYEIKAGWEIPTVLEQNLNSDLPGELKALVTSGVYDTATGKHLLIPQGARLVGKYDSRVSYGQDGVQVVWERIIYPDGSSLDLTGMVGLDAHGNAGLRDRVDHHYKRLLGFAALTSVMSAALAITQRQNQSVLSYPSAPQLAGQAAGRDLNEFGQQVSRRNLNVPPTIRVPAGYRFTVRVNKDIVFDAPYQPLQVDRLFNP